MSSTCHCNTLRLASRKLSALYDEALAPHGINIAQFALLRAIERERTVSITALGRLQDLDRSTVGRNVRVLERAGLVETARSVDDQRESMVRLTTQGTELLARAAPGWQACQSAVEARLGTDRVEALRAILHGL